MHTYTSNAILVAVARRTRIVVSLLCVVPDIFAYSARKRILKTNFIREDASVEIDLVFSFWFSIQCVRRQWGRGI